MTLICLLTPILVALVGMWATIHKPETARWHRRAMAFLLVLTVLAGIYSINQTLNSKKIMEPWEAMQDLHGRMVEAWIPIKEVNQTKDTVRLQVIRDEFMTLAKDAMKSRAPSWYKMRISLLSFLVASWTMAELSPQFDPAEIMSVFSDESLKGGPFEGQPQKLYAMLDLYRIQDFGPPHRVLRGFRPDGTLDVNLARFSKGFVLERAEDLFNELTAMAQ